MAHFRILQLGTIVFSLLLGCTDRRVNFELDHCQQDSSRCATLSSSIDPVADVKFQGKATHVLQMRVYGQGLYLTGTPFGVARWDIGADPQNPVLSASADLMALSNNGTWAPAWYASGAILASGSWIFTSGSFGMSVFTNLAGSSAIQEASRLPGASDGTPVADEARQFAGIEVHPSRAVVYGFRAQGYAYRMDGSRPSALSLVSKLSYGEGVPCCVVGTAVFQNKLFVAFRSFTWIFNLNSDGSLGSKSQFNGLNPIGIAATPTGLFIQHQPVATQTGVTSPGIYAYDSSGRRVGYYPLTTPNGRFAVAPDNRYLYAPYQNAAVRIYRMGGISGGLPVSSSP